MARDFSRSVPSSLETILAVSEQARGQSYTPRGPNFARNPYLEYFSNDLTPIFGRGHMRAPNAADCPVGAWF